MYCGSCGSQMPSEAAFCPSCGAAVARPAGTSASPSGGAPAPGTGTPQAGGGWWAGDARQSTAPNVAPAPLQTDAPAGAAADWSASMLPVAPTRAPRSPARLAVASFGVVAAIVLIVLAAHAWTGKGGGGSSPSDATNRLANAVRHADPFGVAAMVAPGELSSLTREAKGGANRAASFDLLKSGSNPLGFLNLSVDNLKTKVTNLAPGFAKVEFDGGTLSYKVNPSEIPKSWNVDTSSLDPADLQRTADISDAACANRDTGDDEFSSPPPYCLDGNQAPFAILVKQNGRWYFSLAYTGLEYWRLANNLPPADFGSALKAPGTGGSTPEEAVTKLVSAVSSISSEADIERIFQLFPPDELGALYDYRDAIHQALQGDEGDISYPGQLYTILGTPTFDTAAGKGDVRVYANSVRADYSSTDGFGDTTRGTVTVDRHCVTDSASNDGQPQCLTSNVFARDFGVTDIFVSTVKEHGRWYVSPMATLGDYADLIVAHLDKASLDKFKRDLDNFDDGEGFTDSINASTLGN